MLLVQTHLQPVPWPKPPASAVTGNKTTDFEHVENPSSLVRDHVNLKGGASGESSHLRPELHVPHLYCYSTLQSQVRRAVA